MKEKLLLPILALSTLILSPGCGTQANKDGYGSDQMLADRNRCPRTGSMVNLPRFCCDQEGVRIQFTNDCAGPDLASVPAVNGAQTQGAVSAAIAASANDSAEQLAGQSSAALAGGSSLPTQNFLAPERRGTDKSAALGNIGPVGTKPSRDSGSMSNGTSALPALAGGGTQAAPVKPTSASLNPDVPAGMAKSGGAGGVRPMGGDSGFGGSLGGLGGSVENSDGDTTRVQFDGSGETMASMSDDPEDYFTRVAMGANIFKIVERRYQRQALNWAKSDLK